MGGACGLVPEAAHEARLDGAQHQRGDLPRRRDLANQKTGPLLILGPDREPLNIKINCAKGKLSAKGRRNWAGAVARKGKGVAHCSGNKKRRDGEASRRIFRAVQENTPEKENLKESNFSSGVQKKWRSP